MITASKLDSLLQWLQCPPPSCWLTTERLALRRFTPADLDWLADFYSDVEATRYLGGVKSRAEAEAFLDTRILHYYDEHPGLGIWMTVDRATGCASAFTC